MRVFINTGSFAIGLTIAAFAVISDMKVNLAISLYPTFSTLYLSCLRCLLPKKAAVSFDGKKLCSDSRKSLVKLLTYHRPLSELRVVVAISLFVFLFTLLGLLIQVFKGIPRLFFCGNSVFLEES